MNDKLIRVPSAPLFISVAKACEALVHAVTVLEAKQVKDVDEAMRVWSRAQKDGGETQRHAAEIVLRAERRMGEILDAARKSGDRRGKGKNLMSTASTLSDLGVTRDNASRYQKISEIPEDQFEALVTEAKEAAKELTTAAALRLATTSGEVGYDGDEWYTPKYVVEIARAALGGIDLDPASNAHAQKIVQAKTFWTKKDDSLPREWHGRVWLNPPYSYPLVEQFTSKLLAEHAEGRVSRAVLIVNNCTDAAWFHTLLHHPVCFTRGRIGFTNRNGVAFATRQGQALFGVGFPADSFAKSFAQLGTVLGVV